ncbi:MAG: restriction endonuclease [Clostridia bacterium]|nr:restriction endonuclease [Clostridia bacterium]
MKITATKAQNTILEIIENCNQPIARKDFIRNCVEHLGVPLTGEELPGGELNKVKCLLGMLLQQYIRTGIITESDTGFLQYSIGVELDAANRKIEIENILRSLTANTIYEKDNLLDIAYAEYTKKYPQMNVSNDKRNAIRGDIGNMLKSLVADGVIPCDDGKFGFKFVNHREMIKQEIATMSDEEFETKTIEMLTAYFKKNGFTKVTSIITGGTDDDDGVDGIITLPDEFLKDDKIIVQVKHRKNHDKCEPIKEIRGFAGVLAVKAEVYKGIYVTTAKYSKKANEFLKSYSIKRLLLIDGENWVDMAESCGF